MTTGNQSEKERKKTVLLVDDHKNNLLVLKKMLERSGIKVIPAENGKEALDICMTTNDIDLIFMDLKMPVMDGFSAMKEIKKIMPDMKVIAETAFALDGDRQKILEAGFDGYIPKPISAEKLEEILNLNLK
jgi:CheY-like chemotaxis protein